MSGIGEKIKNMLPGHHAEERGRGAEQPKTDDKPRSLSRGRGLHASGRGGAGNMSTSKTRGPDETPEVIAAARAHSHDRAHPHEHAGGRGGAGNMTHEPDAGSRERQKIAEEEEHKVQAEYHERHKNDAHHSGRGGMGNI